MRFKSFTPVGAYNGGALSSGPDINMTGALILNGVPVGPMEVASKGYVDTAFSSLAASKITEGFIAKERLPGYNGDASAPAGSNVFTLANSSVTPGNYPKITVNSKGLVIDSGSLVESEIPALSWSKITSGKPTNLDGYGITNAIKHSGGTLEGNLTMNGNITSSNHAATVEYVDISTASTDNSIPTGFVINRPTATTPNGFLRCNGGVLTKSLYSALYGVIGDEFSTGVGVPGHGKPWEQQYQINELQDTDITDWVAATPTLPFASAGSNFVVIKDKVYIFDRATNASYRYSFATINADGTLGAWSSTVTVSGLIKLEETSCIVYKNFLYVLLIKNVNSSQANDYSNLRIPINSDGTLGTPVLFSMPSVRIQLHPFIVKDRIFSVCHGGNGSTFSAPIDPVTGVIGTWTDTGRTIPVTNYNNGSLILTKNRVYLVGSGSDTVTYTAPINSDGTLGAWVTGPSLPSGLYYSRVFVTKHRAYMFGGYWDASPINTVFISTINIDGTLGTWSTSTALSVASYKGSTFAVKNKLYLFTRDTTLYVGTIKGGLNDYSPYYNGTIDALESTQFKLPDYSNLEVTYPNSYYFIKI